MCEFCDIIVTFGRRPRLKTSTQVIAELNELKIHGMKQVFIVDDNLIGNKAGVKVVLKDIIRYQEQHRYPFRFLTEATLDLAEDDEMMALMAEANINAVFIGIESPKKESLAETRKYQNIRPRAGTLLQRVKKIQAAGIEVACGMIVGFDNDDESIFAAQEHFLTEASIPHAMIGMLYAIPKTPLYERLLIEKRIDSINESSYGTNVIPMNMTRDLLRQGYIDVMRYMNQTSSYFERVDALYLHGRLAYQKMGRFKFLKEHRLDNLMVKLRSILYCTILSIRIIKNVENKGLRREYLSRTVRCLLTTRDVTVCLSYLVKCAIHYHNHKLVEGLSGGKLVSTM